MCGYLELTTEIRTLQDYKNDVSDRTWKSSLGRLRQQISSREANIFSANQEIPYIFWCPRVHYRVYKSTSRAPNLNQNLRIIRTVILKQVLQI